MTTTAIRRLLVAAVLGVAVGVAVTVLLELPLGVLCGFVVTNATFVLVGWVRLWPMTAAETEAHVAPESFSARTGEGLVLFVTVGAVAAIGLVLAIKGSSEGVLGAAVALLGVFMAWAALHLMYAARYAFVYYSVDKPGGIDFNDAGYRPSYRDFLYFSHTLGMTYAVSDTNVTSADVRAIVLRHTLLSYVFGAVVLASTINLVAGIATR